MFLKDSTPIFKDQEFDFLRLVELFDDRCTFHSRRFFSRPSYFSHGRFFDDRLALIKTEIRLFEDRLSMATFIFLPFSTSCFLFRSSTFYFLDPHPHFIKNQDQLFDQTPLKFSTDITFYFFRWHPFKNLLKKIKVTF